MTSELPLVTIIIPTRPGQSEVPALAAVRRLDYPRERLEVLVARGRQPSVQRNKAIQAAQGEWIYFLDDDACPDPANLRRAVAEFADSSVKMLGGPNLCPKDAPLIEQIFAVVLSSWLAFGPSRARYLPLGKKRRSGEKELILCNLAARRADITALGGFDEALYPNEENALMDQLQARGGALIYDPGFLVYRRPRPNLTAFGRMLLTYGRGRAEQFRRHPGLGSALNFVPPFFCLYLLVGPWFGSIGLLPLCVYIFAVLGQMFWSASEHGLVKSFLAMPLVVATHILYGLGFWRGLFTRLGSRSIRPDIEVTLDKITL